MRVMSSRGRPCLLTIMCLGLATGCGAEPPASAPAPAASSPPPADVVPALDPTFPIGLDGEVGFVPVGLDTSFEWDQYGAYAADEIQLFAGVHARTGRINILMHRGPALPDVSKYGYTALDQLVAAYQAQGVRVTMTLTYNVQMKGTNYAKYLPWLPADDAGWAQYSNYVRALVERYDGDGVSDAPGLLYPIFVWQVGNEAEVQYNAAAHPKDSTQTPVPDWETPSDYAELLRRTAPVIHEMMPEAVVVASHMPFTHDDNDYDGNGTPETYISVVNAHGGYEDVNALELHYYLSFDDLPTLAKGIEDIRATTGKDVWAGQVSSPSSPFSNGGGTAYPKASLATQATILPKYLLGALAAGASQAHWYTLEDSINDDGPATEGGQVFAYEGVYYCPGETVEAYGMSTCKNWVTKPSGVNFKAISDAFAGFERVEVVQSSLPESDASLTLKVHRRGREPVVFAWDEGEAQLDVAALFPGKTQFKVVRLVSDEGAAPTEETSSTGTVRLSRLTSLISVD